jgi:ribonuclease HI
MGWHAWILTTDSNKTFLDPTLVISGTGNIFGHPCDMSSARAELQGHTAMAIVAQHLQTLHNIPRVPFSFYYDNQGIVQGCTTVCSRWLHHHRKANMDLYLEYWKASKHLNIQNLWVKGHQDENIEWQTSEDLHHSELPLEAN